MPAGVPSGGVPDHGEADPGLVIREPYLRRVLAEFEAGRLEAYDYTRRVLAINAAASVEAMNAIVEQPPDGTDGNAQPAPLRGPDAVDLARLRTARLSEARSPTTRYVTLAVVFVLFAVLIGIGVWLATHMQGAVSPSGARVGSSVAQGVAFALSAHLPG